jgi:hypothetical protein
MRHLSSRATGFAASLLCLSVAAQAATDRWAFSTSNAHATLSYAVQQTGAPDIMFICGASKPGYAMVILQRLPDARLDRRIRIQISAGSSSAMVAGNAAMDASAPMLVGEFPVAQMRDLLNSSTAQIEWRVSSESRELAARQVFLPNVFARQRAEFLRYCD